MEVRHDVIEHTADTGFRAFAPSLEELFEECAVALFRMMYPSPERGERRSHVVASQADSLPDLLVAWLSDLLWLAETEHLALDRFQVDEVSLTEVRGRVVGVDLDTVELSGPPVKAVTYHGLELRNEGGWQATVFLDV